MLRTIIFFILIFIFSLSYGQNGIVKGTVSGAGNELLVGVNVYEENMKFATVTNINGEYSLSISPGSYTIVFHYVGKEVTSRNVELNEGETVIFDVFMEEKYENIDPVVVSASKFERRQSEETVSIEVMQGDLIERQNPLTIEESLNRIPGVVIMDGQPQIRGGSGWSYGSGSRVQVLLDGIPILSADAADPKWDMIPPDIIHHVEVIKGAASALYGSASMNGIINFQTISPSPVPLTKVRASATLYGNPADQDLKWWQDEQLFDSPRDYTLGITHSRKIKQFDLVAGLYYNDNISYLKSKYNKQYRAFGKLRYRFSKKLKGLAAGINVLASTRKNRTFLVWNGLDSLGYLPLPNSTPEGRNNRLAIDPFIQYTDDKNNSIIVRGRYFNSTNRIISDSTQASKPTMFYGEGQYQRKFDKINFILTTGISGSRLKVRSLDGNPENALAGEHDGSNVALYAQIEKELWNKLSIAAGMRWEYFQIDSMDQESSPNSRIGINYHPNTTTFIRASYGQAYRFPSIAERFAKTNIGGIGIFPNPKLEPERGFTVEAGVKQLFEFGNWKGFADVAGFYNRYNNMIEFTFGQFGADVAPPFFGLGFSAQNVGDTEIVGLEISSSLQGKIGRHTVNLIAGYYYISPGSLNWNDTLTTYNEKGKEIRRQTYAETSSSEENYLKYRFSHSFKSDLEITFFNKFRTGIYAQYRSFTRNIDQTFVSDLFISLEPLLNTRAFSGIKDWRTKTEGEGEFILDLRLSYLINEKTTISFLIKNVTNNTYVQRPAIFEAPRNYTIKFSMNI